MNEQQKARIVELANEVICCLAFLKWEYSGYSEAIRANYDARQASAEAFRIAQEA